VETTHIVGIDPGLVHTGLVRMIFLPIGDRIIVQHHVVLGDKPDEVADWIGSTTCRVRARIFGEDYRTRSSFNTDPRMREAVSNLKARLPSAVFLDNMGVKGVVKRPLMELLGVWKFSTPTHHQDLRSAARIALFGMLKDPELNAVITAAVKAHLAGRPWQVIHS
jgi:hypothetical protein